jgi:hypothetical protein
MIFRVKKGFYPELCGFHYFNSVIPIQETSAFEPFKAFKVM